MGNSPGFRTASGRHVQRRPANPAFFGFYPPPGYMRYLGKVAHNAYLYEREKALFIKIFGADKWKRPAPLS